MIQLYQQSSRYIKIVPNQERERDIDKTHSYWYKPSAPRVNYSLLAMETAGMMKMASDDGFPPPVGCRKRVVDEIVEVQRLAEA